MDGKQQRLMEKLENLLQQTAEVAVALDRADGSIVGVPHYSVIELKAHELGKKLSRQVQQLQMQELAAGQFRKAPCPKCGTCCEVAADAREVKSIDGVVELTDLKAKCPKCRNFFFPAASDTGIRLA